MRLKSALSLVLNMSLTLSLLALLTPTGSCVMYWKPSFPDYAPSGVPDFDQRQDAWTNPTTGQWSWCGPVAVANSLWWLDSQYETGVTPPSTISDTFPLVQSYNATVWDDHDSRNVPPFIEDLAWYMDVDGMRTGVPHNGTNVLDMQYGISEYLKKVGLSWKFYENTVAMPDFYYIEKEIERGEDVILLLGFWQNVTGEWIRVGGHYVTVSGVDSEMMAVAFSDPILNNAEPPPHGTGGPGRVLPPPPHPHPPSPPDTVHNYAEYISHDLYVVSPSLSPGGEWGIEEYNMTEETVKNFQGQSFPEEFLPNKGPYDPGLPVYTEIEYAVIVSCQLGVFAAGSSDGNVHVFDFDGTHLWNYSTGAEVVSIAMSIDGEYIAVGSLMNKLYLFHKNGTQLWYQNVSISKSLLNGWMGSESKSVDISADGEYIVAAATDGLYLYGRDGTLIWNHTVGENVARISADGNYIVACDYDVKACFFSSLYDGVPGWSSADGTPIWETPYIFSYWVAIDGLGEYVTVSSRDNVYLFDRNGVQIWRYTLNRTGFTRVDMAWDGRSLVSVNDDPTNSLGTELCYFNDTKDGTSGWNSTDGTPVWTFRPTPISPTHDFLTVDISKYGSVIAAGHGPYRIYVLSRDGAILQNLTDGTLQSVDLTLTGQYGAAGDSEGIVYFFSKDSSSPLWNYTVGGIVHSVAISEVYPCMLPYPNHDVAVTNIRRSFTNHTVVADTALNVTVTVTNEGYYNETFYLRAALANSTKWIPHPTPALVTLLPNTSKTFTNLTWTITEGGLKIGNYTIIATASLVQDEIDVCDNTCVDGWAVVTIPGDIDASGEVDIFDAITFAGHFGHEPPDGHPPGTPEYTKCFSADINCDNIVDVLDAIILSTNFGKIDP